MAKNRYKHKSTSRPLQKTGVYLMGNMPLIFVCKFGISDNVQRRTKEVSDSTPGMVFRIFSINAEFGYRFEQFIHSVYSFINFRFFSGSGRTEWFFNLNIIVGILANAGIYYFDIAAPLHYRLMLIFSPVIWLDGLLWLLIFLFARLLLFVTGAGILLYILAHAHA